MDWIHTSCVSPLCQTSWLTCCPTHPYTAFSLPSSEPVVGHIIDPIVIHIPSHFLCEVSGLHNHRCTIKPSLYSGVSKTCGTKEKQQERGTVRGMTARRSSEQETIQVPGIYDMYMAHLGIYHIFSYHVRLSSSILTHQPPPPPLYLLLHSLNTLAIHPNPLFLAHPKV